MAYRAHRFSRWLTMLLSAETDLGHFQARMVTGMIEDVIS